MIHQAHEDFLRQVFRLVTAVDPLHEVRDERPPKGAVQLERGSGACGDLALLFRSVPRTFTHPTEEYARGNRCRYPSRKQHLAGASPFEYRWRYASTHGKELQSERECEVTEPRRLLQ